MECTTPSSLLPSPITSATRSASVPRCSSFCTSSSNNGAGFGNRSAIRWISLIRSKPVSTSSAPSSCATRAMWKAIDESVMIPVTRMRLPSRNPAISVLISLVAHAHAAVDRDHRTRYVAGILGREEAHHPGDLLGSANALRRDEFQCPRLNPLIQRAGHLGVDVARGHHVGGYSSLRQLPGDRAGHADQTGLGGRVIGLVADAPGAGDRTHEDHPTKPLPLHAPRC